MDRIYVQYLLDVYILNPKPSNRFEMDRIYVQYLLDVPEHWTYQDASSLWGNTQLSSTRFGV